MSRRDLTQQDEVVFGRNYVLEVLKSGRKVAVIYIDNAINEQIAKGYSKDSRISDIIGYAKEKSIAVEVMQKEQIKAYERTYNTRSEGVLAKVTQRQEFDVADILEHCKNINKEPFILVINNLLYEENLGAILRSSAAGGVDAIILPKREKRYVTPTVERISMGGAEYVPVINENLFQAIDFLKEAGLKVYGVELNGSEYYYDADLTGPIVLVIGGEDAGVTGPLQKRCEKIVKIPMLRPIQSLNVSVSTGILIYEKIRQECHN